MTHNYLESTTTRRRLSKNERDAGAVPAGSVHVPIKAAIDRQYKNDVAAARALPQVAQPLRIRRLHTLNLQTHHAGLRARFRRSRAERFVLLRRSGKVYFPAMEQILNCWKSAGHAQSTAQALGEIPQHFGGHIGLRMGGDMFYDISKSFGIMEKTGVDLPGEASGLF